jgi:hypothetical protein
MKVRLTTDCSAGRSGAVVEPSRAEADRLVRAGAAYPLTRDVPAETAAAEPAEEVAAVRVGRPRKAKP